MIDQLNRRIVSSFWLLLSVYGLAGELEGRGQTCVTWIQRRDVGTPGKRISPAMAYDSDRGVTVFFGGEYSDAGSSTISYYNDTWEYDGVHWQKFECTTLPGTRSGHTLIYDTARKQVVLFGGVNEEGYFNDTWVYHPHQGALLGTWERKKDLYRPPPEYSARAGHAMVFDSIRGSAFMSGGVGGSDSSIGAPPEVRLKDLEQWDGTNWTDLGELYEPGIKQNYVDFNDSFARHAMAFDSQRGNVLLTGGTYYYYIPVQDKYTEYENEFLYQIIPVLEPGMKSVGSIIPRQQFAMVYDSFRDCIVVFGGVQINTQPHVDVGNNHQELFFSATNGGYGSRTMNIPTPPPRARHAMVYDSKRQVTVLFGGVSGDTRYDDTWELTNVRPEFVGFDPTNQTVEACSVATFDVVVNGDSPQTFQWLKDGKPLINDARYSQVTSNTGPYVFNMLTIQDTRIADNGRYSVLVTGPCGTNTSPAASLTVSKPWTLISTNGPQPRYQHGMAYDEARGVTVVYGGQLSGNIPNGETWEWNGNTWFLRATNGPAARFGVSMAYDSARGKTVLFGGIVNNSSSYNDYRGETWEWDGSQWTLQTTNGPAARAYAAMAYDIAAQRFVLFGGYLFTNFNLARPYDTWEYDGHSRTWKQVADGAPKPLGGEEALVYDSRRNKRVLLTDGLISYGESPFLLVWEWDGTNWVRQSPQLDPSLVSYQGGPTKVSGEAVAYNPRRGQVVINNGNDGNYVQATWAYDGVGWQLLSVNAGPRAEGDGKMVYDIARDALVQFGGADNHFYVGGETWEWTDADRIEILKQPTSVNTAINQTAQFSVTARGKPLLRYQWRKNGVNVADGARITGSQSGTLSIANSTPPEDQGTYDVQISNDCGSALSDPAGLQFVSAGPVLDLAFASSRWLLNWPTNNTVLESASRVTGPWSEVIGASSPFPILTNQPTRFFRVRQN
jgi:hypothetical protein